MRNSKAPKFGADGGRLDQGLGYCVRMYLLPFCATIVPSSPLKLKAPKKLRGEPLPPLLCSFLEFYVPCVHFK